MTAKQVAEAVDEVREHFESMLSRHHKQALAKAAAVLYGLEGYMREIDGKSRGPYCNERPFKGEVGK